MFNRVPIINLNTADKYFYFQNEREWMKTKKAVSNYKTAFFI
jgi:hypothetical protein